MAAGDPARLTTRLEFAYDGTAFAGWAAQPGLRTVEGELTRALSTIRRIPTRLTVAGRTDRGVHALAQVASHEGPPADPRAVNAVLPADIAVASSELAQAGFDARRDATSRAYRYQLDNGPTRPVEGRSRVLWWPHALDRGLLAQCASLLVGEHRLTAFTPAQTGHIHFRRRILHAEWVFEGTRLDFLIEGESFLRHMIRILAGTMLEVASGERGLADFRALLDGGERDDAGPTAKARGLTLLGIGYGERLLGPSGVLSGRDYHQ